MDTGITMPISIPSLEKKTSGKSGDKIWCIIPFAMKVREGIN